ncbi:hypothetical protein [Acinetobacter sp. SFA]|uniref:hypothetical protein n=1 Tax=Acinetobacter sp. SFA TaxID=1805633 RepID=UPI0014896D66|nr:hypothetical protein [Acinetobacter sp. SFA]
MINLQPRSTSILPFGLLCHPHLVPPVHRSFVNIRALLIEYKTIKTGSASILLYLLYLDATEADLVREAASLHAPVYSLCIYDQLNHHAKYADQEKDGALYQHRNFPFILHS